jgi:hypothetical protein
MNRIKDVLESKIKLAIFLSFYINKKNNYKSNFMLEIGKV